LLVLHMRLIRMCRRRQIHCELSKPKSSRGLLQLQSKRLATMKNIRRVCLELGRGWSSGENCVAAVKLLNPYAHVALAVSLFRH